MKLKIFPVREHCTRAMGRTVLHVRPAGGGRNYSLPAPRAILDARRGLLTGDVDYGRAMGRANQING